MAMEASMSDLEANRSQEEQQVEHATSHEALQRAAEVFMESFRPSWRWLFGRWQFEADEDSDRQGEEDVDPSVGLLDSMEKGAARQMGVDLLMPLRRSSRLSRFHVLRSADRLRYTLYSDSGEFILHADVSPESSAVLFFRRLPPDEFSGEIRRRAKGQPVFVLVFDQARAEWQLLNGQCEHCQLMPPHRSCSKVGKQKLAHIRHSVEAVGDGIFRHMEVRIPGIYSDGSRVTWCPMLQRGDLGAPPQVEGESQHLVALKPVWNSEVSSLVLDLKGRETISSAKNFQLALQHKPKHLLCQYAKLGANTFSLDFKFPLSPAQAFGVAMTTVFWK